ncbi:hypothetical protein Cadr_000024009 [Camelus dromedarius]|uniref:Uncharacterized protein n=1 Tax=Camelus dromedarius TaxID=9838 RepID=A0A5N4CXN9_CAMDR|nr:hypothetical protein Cadr_000024009 [Camelus dromedarius]
MKAPCAKEQPRPFLFLDRWGWKFPHGPPTPELCRDGPGTKGL